MPNIQVADENDPRLVLGYARDAAWDRLQALQTECGCQGGATCVTCAPAASEHMRLAMEYQNLYSTQWVVRTNDDSWWNSPVAARAWQGDADETER